MNVYEILLVVMLGWMASLDLTLAAAGRGGKWRPAKWSWAVASGVVWTAGVLHFSQFA